MKYLLDTCVLSEYVKKKPNSQVINWVDAQDEQSLFVSILSIAELKIRQLAFLVLGIDSK